MFLHFSSNWGGIRYGKRQFCRLRRTESLVLLVRSGVNEFLSAERTCKASVTTACISVCQLLCVSALVIREFTKYIKTDYLTLILLTWTIWRAPTNASKWRMGFNSAFKGLSCWRKTVLYAPPMALMQSELRRKRQGTLIMQSEFGWFSLARNHVFSTVRVVSN